MWADIPHLGAGAGAAVASKGAVRAAAEGRAAEGRAAGGREAGVERRRRRGRDNEQGVWRCYGAASGGDTLAPGCGWRWTP